MGNQVCCPDAKAHDNKQLKEIVDEEHETSGGNGVVANGSLRVSE
jgi:hypothetical protein